MGTSLVLQVTRWSLAALGDPAGAGDWNESTSASLQGHSPGGQKQPSPDLPLCLPGCPIYRGSEPVRTKNPPGHNLLFFTLLIVILYYRERDILYIECIIYRIYYILY